MPGLRFDVITLFPETIESYCRVGILGRGWRQGLLDIRAHHLRDWGLGTHRRVDDVPYGGGTGMILRPEPVFDAHESIDKAPDVLTILLTPRGQLLDQAMVRQTLAARSQVILISGRYEGYDERIASLADLQISVGNFILSGGEIAAMAIIDSASRLLPGVLPKGEQVHGCDSFSDSQATHLEAPQYTRPSQFRGMEVPQVLRSGDHEAIRSWRRHSSGL